MLLPPSEHQAITISYTCCAMVSSVELKHTSCQLLNKLPWLDYLTGRSRSRRADAWGPLGRGRGRKGQWGKGNKAGTVTTLSSSSSSLVTLFSSYYRSVDLLYKSAAALKIHCSLS